jgi:hypothetical protein
MVSRRKTPNELNKRADTDQSEFLQLRDDQNLFWTIVEFPPACSTT